MFKTKVAEEIETYILRSITFVFLNRAVYEIMWQNMVEPDRPQETIWGMRIVCWIPKATHTLTIYNTYCLSTATIVVRTRLHITPYLHYLSCLRLNSVLFCRGLRRLLAKMKNKIFKSKCAFQNVLVNFCEIFKILTCK